MLRRGPLARARHRYSMRYGRPSREQVDDEVEAALAQEIQAMTSMSIQVCGQGLGLGYV